MTLRQGIYAVCALGLALLLIFDNKPGIDASAVSAPVARSNTDRPPGSGNGSAATAVNPSKTASTNSATSTTAQSSSTSSNQTSRRNELAANSADTAVLELIPRDVLVGDKPSNQLPHRHAFGTQSWNPPVARVAVPVKAPPPPPPIVEAPTAPALTLKFIGKKLEAGRWEVYLTQGDQTLIAREGDSLSGNYKVERIDPPTLTLSYLPLNQQQTLNIGNAQ